MKNKTKHILNIQLYFLFRCHDRQRLVKDVLSALYKFRTVRPEIVIYMSVKTWYSDSVQG